MADEYLSEYVPASARRIEFLSGFTGSSALIVVLPNGAEFFTDSRYTLQAKRQIPAELFTIRDSADKSPPDWLAENTRRGMKIGFDPWLHSEKQFERLKKALAKTGAELVAVESNPVDVIWQDRPAPPLAEIFPYDVRYAGKSSDDKRREIADELKRKGISAAIIADASSVAWMLNVRGGDVPHTPLPLSFAILRDDASVEWFVDRRKTNAHADADVTILDPADFIPALRRLGANGENVSVDPDETSHKIVETLRAAGAKLHFGDDPCAMPKACKNAAELAGMRAAHVRDGVALVKFLAWFDTNAGWEKLTELAVEEKLAGFRAEQELYRGPSFDTIAGFASNGAIVHYRATTDTNRTITGDSLLLLDSGAQYLDGTTDVTRTIAVGTPSPEMRDRFTRVLKGHIALAAIRFPAGTTGAELDILARQFLWAAGLDYGHGTGHGVGSYLGVHEGPQGISRRGDVALKAGMVLSNEPGYYKPDHYGIRIENLQAVVELPELKDSSRKFLGFEPLTLAPIDRKIIAAAMLTTEERDWLNKYHLRVYDTIKPHLNDAEAAWLMRATEIL